MREFRPHARSRRCRRIGSIATVSRSATSGTFRTFRRPKFPPWWQCGRNSLPCTHTGQRNAFPMRHLNWVYANASMCASPIRQLPAVPSWGRMMAHSPDWWEAGRKTPVSRLCVLCWICRESKSPASHSSRQSVMARPVTRPLSGRLTHSSPCCEVRSSWKSDWGLRTCTSTSGETQMWVPSRPWPATVSPRLSPVCR
ncbi:Uncharacterised protein [Mycobacteroides abscessus]|nr:Uncharacterised protein [Mycobacteroides abscessus]